MNKSAIIIDQDGVYRARKITELIERSSSLLTRLALPYSEFGAGCIRVSNHLYAV
ncbi:MAG: hypothetical protein PHD43_01210 [Methylococcales bacterium]|nr:hypothetical protein [Methylococcales bacterium]